MQEATKKEKMVFTREKRRVIFYILLMLIPCLEFFFFFIYVNFNSFLLAFQQYTVKSDDIGYNVTFTLFGNFSEAWDIIASSGTMIKNSLYLYLCNLAIVSSLSLFFSYYMAKQFAFSGFFRVMLFLPQVISSIVFVLLYKYMVNDGMKLIFTKLFSQEWLEEKGLQNGFLGVNAPETVNYITVLIYNIWIGFGVKSLIYTGSMSSIDTSIIEAGQLDGVNLFQEFFHIYIPMIYPTFVTFVVTGITTIFTSTMSLIPFYGTTQAPPFNVFGFFLYKETLKGNLVSSGHLSYSVLSSIGIMITLVLVPITLTTKKLLEKYGPSTD